MSYHFDEGVMMADIKISGRKLSVTDAMRDRVEDKIGMLSKYLTSRPCRPTWC